jgi:hypothetical protein
MNNQTQNIMKTLFKIIGKIGNDETKTWGWPNRVLKLKEFIKQTPTLFNNIVGENQFKNIKEESNGIIYNNTDTNRRLVHKYNSLRKSFDDPYGVMRKYNKLLDVIVSCLIGNYSIRDNSGRNYSIDLQMITLIINAFHPDNNNHKAFLLDLLKEVMYKLKFEVTTITGIGDTRKSFLHSIKDLLCNKLNISFSDHYKLKSIMPSSSKGNPNVQVASKEEVAKSIDAILDPYYPDYPEESTTDSFLKIRKNRKTTNRNQQPLPPQNN